MGSLRQSGCGIFSTARFPTHTDERVQARTWRSVAGGSPFVASFAPPSRWPFASSASNDATSRARGSAARAEAISAYAPGRVNAGQFPSSRRELCSRARVAASGCANEAGRPCGTTAPASLHDNRLAWAWSGARGAVAVPEASRGSHR